MILSLLFTNATMASIRLVCLFLSTGIPPRDFIRPVKGNRNHSFFIRYFTFNPKRIQAQLPYKKSQLLVCGAATSTHFFISGGILPWIFQPLAAKNNLAKSL